MRKKNTSNTFNITKTERAATRALASIFGLRMIGLFMILPIFSLYANHFNHVTPLLIGMALGAYGVTSGFLQAPLGALSDKIGRKPVIIIGLVIFALGSILCAHSHSIYGIIAGRALQGAGAIGSTLLACAADLTREEVRTKAMAIMGITIGVSFVIAMILGPILAVHFGISGIFDLTALCAILAIIIVYLKVPNPKKTVFHRDQQIDKRTLKSTLKNTQLLRLDLGIFCLHAILTATFIVLPLALTDQLHLSKMDQAWVYAPVLILSFLLMVPFVIMAETKHKMKQVFLSAIALFGLSQLGFIFLGSHISAVVISLIIFFTAFVLLEATLPSLVSKLAPISSKGTALGVYSSCQFFGAFAGGSVGGFLYGEHHISGVYVFCLVLALIWFIFAITMEKPAQVATRMIHLSNIKNEKQAHELEQKLLKINGIKQAKVIVSDKIAYLKVESKVLNEDDLLKFAD
jgi:MFS family permease